MRFLRYPLFQFLALVIGVAFREIAFAFCCLVFGMEG